jgi:hypothetical protein
MLSQGAFANFNMIPAQYLHLRLENSNSEIDFVTIPCYNFKASFNYSHFSFTQSIVSLSLD